MIEVKVLSNVGGTSAVNHFSRCTKRVLEVLKCIYWVMSKCVDCSFCFVDKESVITIFPIATNICLLLM